jgi:FtsP/CotA-like multicopper oxidase with cupredoxin domain
VTHTNKLGVPTVAHLHGGVTRPEFDGFPTDAIAQGEARRYEYSNAGRAATLWYHDHHHLLAGRNLYMGLAGFYLLEDSDEINGRLPREEYDIPLMLQDRAFTPDGELWRFVNRSFLGVFTMLHPVHTHLAPFQILRRNGRAPLTHEGGWKDTVAIDRGENVDVIIRWGGYRGRYLLHCHNLEHEDHSMMARVEVT